MTASSAWTPGRIVVLAWSLLALSISLAAWPRMDRLGLYYDEAFMAQQARDFVEPHRAGNHPASVRTAWVLGRPFPLRNAAYLGSLKSQLTIPAFALFGATPQVLRGWTLATGLLGLLLAMLWAARAFGTGTAVLGGLLVAADPSFYFFSQFEWGPFTTNLLCRAAGALLVVVAWQAGPSRRALWAAAGAGLAFGLGVFSRADFALILAGGGTALLVTQPGRVGAALRERRAVVAVGAAGLLVASTPMLLSLLDLLASSGAVADRGDLAFRTGVLRHVLDGSQFLRLMEVGGVFERAADVSAAASPFGAVAALSCVYLAWEMLRARHGGESHGPDPRAFLVVATPAIVLGTLLLPGAVRAHHQLNALPLPHFAVAAAALAAWRASPSPRVRATLRSVVALMIGATLAAGLRGIVLTQASIDASGGRGRWTHALSDFAAKIDQAEQRVVSLDWGFHEPLLFLTDSVQLVEAIWTIPHALVRGEPWRIEGDQRSVYLVHDAPYDVFGLGPDLLLRMRIAREDGVTITEHRDGEGNVAFHAVRIPWPHRLSYTGRFALRRLPDPAPP